jgi:methylated-DNA-[protein]-cysteine S-methyltransferase
MNVITTRFYKTPYGELVLGALNDRLCLCDWRYRKLRGPIDARIALQLQAAYAPGDAPVLDETQRQLDQYFRAERTQFDLPLQFAGSAFQIRVWEELLRVEYGQTATYLALAEGLGNRNAVRAVAGANGANAIAIIVPCHRIIGNGGELVGYAGGLRAKEKLLALETGLFTLK